MNTTMKFFALALTLVSTSALADSVKITAGGHTIEFPCSEITDDTDLTCEEACAELDASSTDVSCEVIDGIMYIESDEWITGAAISREVSSFDDSSSDSSSKTPTRRVTTRR